MPKESKFSLVDVTKEETKDFMEKFNAFVTESGMYFEPVPQFTRKNIGDPWEIVCQVILQKKVPIKEDVVSPIQDVAPTETA